MSLCLDQFYHCLPVLLAADSEPSFERAWRSCCLALDLHRPVVERGRDADSAEEQVRLSPARLRVSAPALAGGGVALSFDWPEERAPPSPGLEAALAMLVFARGRTVDRATGDRGMGVSARGAGLSPREADCLAWVARGKTNWEIGRILDVEARTVQFHICNAARKLGVAGRHQAMLRATMHGLLVGYPLRSAAADRRPRQGVSPQRRRPAHAPGL
jgi:DNA-binding CsgD family transcriptional regulator